MLLFQGWTDADANIFRALWGDGPGSATCQVKGAALLVANKTDLAEKQQQQQQQSSDKPAFGDNSDLLLPLVARESFNSVVRTSATTRAGLDELEAAILELAGAPQVGVTEALQTHIAVYGAQL